MKQNVNPNAEPCKVFAVRRNQAGGFNWKWQQTHADGSMKQSDKQFPLFFECVQDARRNGYKPNVRCI